MKRAIIGTACSVLCAALGIIGLAAYIINSNTTYFSGLGKNGIVIGASALGIAALLVWCALGEARASWKDLLPVAAPALLIVAFLTLLNSRINGIAAIMTFEANEQNFADLQSALVALIFLAVAAILSAINAFFDVKKSGMTASDREA